MADNEANPPAPVRLWGGRFGSGPAEALARLSVSVQFDWRLAPYDLLASAAHARVLHRAGCSTTPSWPGCWPRSTELGRACRDGSFRPDASDEDVHTALERGLLERVGSLGGKLRAGRSRNDQVATDLRMYLRDQARTIVARLTELRDGAAGPGRAAPGHPGARHDPPAARAAGAARAPAARARAGVRQGREPAARTGTSAPPSARSAPAPWPGRRCALDPDAVAAELGFESAAENSMDAVSDRDFAAEFCFAAALLGVHLSRLGEEVVLWSSHEFGWAELDDAYSTGSSIMPQKKNPDVAELARGKAGRLIGGLTAVLTTLKGLPLTYNRDLQEDKEPVFDAVDTLLIVLPAMAGLIGSLRFHTERLARQAPAGHALATDLAELLVRRGVAFREAHEVVGHLVVWCQVHDCELADVSDADLARISPLLTPDVREVLTVDGALAARSARGGTAPARVAEQLDRLRTVVEDQAAWAAGS